MILNPEVSQAAGLVIQTLNLVPGPTLTALQRAAEKATAVSELPDWALKVLSVVKPNAS